MKRIVSALLLAVGAPLLAADPYVGYIYPSGIRPGTTNRFVVGGQFLWGVKEMHFSSSGLHVLDIEHVPNFAPPTGIQRRHLVKWLDGIAAGKPEEPPLPKDPHLNEWRSNTWWMVLNTLDAGKLAIVEFDLHVPRNPLQATPSLRQLLLVTIAADTNAPAGRRSFSVSNNNGISAPRPFMVSPAPRAEEPLYVPPHRPQPGPRRADVRTGEVVLDGQILPGSTDTFLLRLAANRRYAFKVTARELQPYIGDAVPGFFNPVITLKDARGNTVAVADDSVRFRPDPVLEYLPPADDEYRLEIHDVLYRGRSDFVYAIAVGDATPSSPPAADGVVERPGTVSTKTFTIDSPGPRVLDITARRKGSPLDAVLTLRKASGGPPLAQWDDVTNTVFTGTVPQGECDPIGTYDFTEPGQYVAEVTDRTGHGGKEYVWWLDVRRPMPDFEVYSTRSTLPLRGGQPLKVGFRILRKDGFDGTVTLDFPKGIRVSGGVATSGVDTVTSWVTYTERQKLDLQPIQVFARATIGGKVVRHPVIPCDEYEQAFAWKHLVPAEAFLARRLPGALKNPQKKNAPKKNPKKKDAPPKMQSPAPKPGQDGQQNAMRREAMRTGTP